MRSYILFRVLILIGGAFIAARIMAGREIEISSFENDPVANCGDPCRIEYNPGGDEFDFMAVAYMLPVLKQRGAMIDGYCASACAIFADIARANVCVTRGAEFFFHRDSAEAIPPNSRDVIAWVEAHGGFPSFASHRTTPMVWPDTKRFWRECSHQEIDAAR